MSFSRSRSVNPCHSKSSEKPQLLNLHEYELYLQDSLPRNAKDYYHSGSNDMITLRENRAPSLV
jgi:hypothetical protein